MRFFDDNNFMAVPSTTARDDDLAALNAFLETIASALSRRDHGLVAAQVGGGMASHLPREVREELLLVAGQPVTGFRVAIEFLRYRHRMRELARGGESLSPAQLELALGVGAGRDPIFNGWSTGDLSDNDFDDFEE